MSLHWPLPDTPHLPGTHPRPEASVAYDAAHAAPVYTVDRMWRENESWLFSVALYNGGFFWEANEVLEAICMRAPAGSRERTFLQALIQLSHACLKLSMQRPEAAARLLGTTTVRLSDPSITEGTLMGVSVAPLAAAVRQFADALVADEGRPLPDLLEARPRIQLEGIAAERAT